MVGKMKHILWKLWCINAVINTICAISFRELGWINCALQLWIVTYSLYICREKIESEEDE